MTKSNTVGTQLTPPSVDFSDLVFSHLAYLFKLSSQHSSVKNRDQTCTLACLVTDPPEPVAVKEYVVGAKNVGVVKEPEVPLMFPPAKETDVAFVDDQLITEVLAYQVVSGATVIVSDGIGEGDPPPDVF